MSLGGALGAAVGAFIAWFDIFGGSANGFDVPAPFLFDYQTTASADPSVGLLVLALAGMAGVAAVVPLLADRLQLIRLMGVALLAVAAAFLFQLLQAADAIGASFGDIYGIGPFVTAAGAIVLLFDK